MSLQRIMAIALNVVREIIRDNLMYFIVFYAIVMGIAAIILPQVSLGSHTRILLDFGLALTSWICVFVAVFLGSGLLNKEVARRTILTLLPKPLSRTELLFGKLLGLLTVQFIMIVSMTVLLLFILSIFRYGYNFISLLLAQFFLFLEVAIVGAFALLFGSFTGSILGAFLTFGIYLIGHLSTDLFSLSLLSKNKSLLTISHVFYLFFPDLERLNLRNRVLYENHFNVVSLLSDFSYAVVYTFVLLTIGIFIFSRREF